MVQHSIGSNNKPFDPLEERLQDYDEVWEFLAYHIIEYDWNYRKNICSKCPLETQQKFKCFKINTFKIMDDKKIQKTYCSKLKKARTNKFRNHIKNILSMSPLLKIS